VKLLIDILQGLGLAQAAGIRPFLPALVASGAARADLLVDLEDTPFAFMEQTWWIAALAAAALTALILRVRIAASPPLASALQGLALGMGGLLFSAALASGDYTWWPGIPAGIAAAWLAATATADLFARAGARLDEDARSHLPVYGEGIAVALAVLSILAPPVALVSAGFFVWLLLGSRRRRDEKHAGLRVLR
jgi:hypothetical protein